jgi:hypothetical protein
MYRIPQDRLGTYNRLGYVQNDWVYIMDWAMYRIPQDRLGIYLRLGFVQNTTGQVGYIS